MKLDLKLLQMIKYVFIFSSCSVLVYLTINNIDFFILLNSSTGKWILLGIVSVFFNFVNHCLK